MKIRKAVLLFVALIPVSLFAQNIKGKVFGKTKEGKAPLVGAVVTWSNSNDGAITDAEGAFTIRHPKGLDTLTCSYIGHSIDTLIVGGRKEVEFVLTPQDIDFDNVVIRNRKSNVLSSRTVNKTETITFAGLCKMACCNLAESFENSASVTVGYSDAVSGARQIKMLGYAGIYTQMLDETRPIMRGLSAPYGLSFVPGMWLKGIQMSKGVTSVVNGYEALTGQINLEHRKPTDEDPLFVNLYFDQDLRAEANVTSALQINDKLSTVILTHASLDKKSIDHNHDGFLDSPLKEHYNFANRWLYAPKSGVQLRAGIRFLSEDRDGGQMSFDKKRDRGTQNSYGSLISNRDFNAYVKTGIPIIQPRVGEDDPMFSEQTVSNVAFIADYNYHTLNSFFGFKEYDGSQHSFMFNGMYQINYGSRHKLVSGVSFTADNFKESLLDKYSVSKNEDGTYNTEQTNFNFDREDYTVGVFSEYTFDIADKLTFVAGLRLDHNDDYGFMFSPRGHLKWNLTGSTVFRASGGVGFRNSTLIADNVGILATGRKIVIDSGIERMERGSSYGASLTQIFKFFNDDEASISVDYFRSGFSNQVIADQEYDSNTIFFYNIDGKSYTNTYQVDFTFEPLQRLNVTATFRYNDTEIALQKHGLVERPLIDRYKGVLNLQYATKLDKWTFDFTAQINGASRLPVQNGDISTSLHSPSYPVYFAQVTKKFRKVDIYLGVENIADYKQEHPIISAGDPFSSKFNSTVVWGPLMGRKTYIGMRFTL